MRSKGGSMRVAIAGSVSVLLFVLAGCSNMKMECEEPEQCGGNPCCWSGSIDPDEHGTSGSTAPGACVPAFGVDSFVTRTCHTDADCTSGGVSTEAIHCCKGGQSFRACFEIPCS